MTGKAAKDHQEEQSSEAVAYRAPAAVPGRQIPRQKRIPCNPTCVLVHVQDRDNPLEAQVLDVSKSGFLLRLGSFLCVGACVRVSLGRLIITGEIRYCRENGPFSFDAGLEISDVVFPSTSRE